jgi:hypothetical protein
VPFSAGKNRIVHFARFVKNDFSIHTGWRECQDSNPNRKVLETCMIPFHHTPNWYSLHESNVPFAVHSRAPYHRIGLVSMVARPGFDPGCLPYESKALARGRAIGLAGEERFELPTVRFKVCRATDCATRP